MDLVVFGANGPTGRQVVKQALAASHHVTAVTRKPSEYPIAAPLLRVFLADVTDQRSVDEALIGANAVISTYGVPYSRGKITVYSEGITNIIGSMRHHDLTRLVCVSSTTVAPGKAPGESWFWRKVLVPLLRHTFGRTLYDDMQRMETIVQGSGLDWTIIRPGGLFNTPQPTSDYEVSDQRLTGRMTSRADLAEALLQEATGQQHASRIREVITRSQLPDLKTFFKDAFGA